MMIDTETMLTAYIESALWAETDDDGDPLDDTYGPGDIALETIDELREDVEGFAGEPDLTEDWSEYVRIINVKLAEHGRDWTASEQAGHDFYLTRNGHGAGFWDRGLGDLGDRLTAAAEVYGTAGLMPGDDGKLYGHN